MIPNNRIRLVFFCVREGFLNAWRALCGRYDISMEGRSIVFYPKCHWEEKLHR